MNAAVARALARRVAGAPDPIAMIHSLGAQLAAVPVRDMVNALDVAGVLRGADAVEARQAFDAVRAQAAAEPAPAPALAPEQPPVAEQEQEPEPVPEQEHADDSTEQPPPCEGEPPPDDCDDGPEPTDADAPDAPPPCAAEPWAAPVDDRVPPCAPESEAVLASAAVLGMVDVADLPPAGAFYDQRAAAVVAAVRSLAARGVMPDLELVAGELRTAGTLAEVGGLPGLVSYIDATPAITNLEPHIAKVSEAWSRRRVMHSALMLRGRAQDPTTPLDALLEEHRAALDGFAVTRQGGESVAVMVGDVVAAWRDEGPIERVPTGIEPLDQLSRGGNPAIGRSVIIGAPSAGKTFIAGLIAHSQATAEGVAVGWLGSDEDVEDVVVRFGQMGGIELDGLEQCEARALDNLVATYAAHRIVFYRGNVTIELAAADLRQRYPDGPALLVVDSLQTVTCDEGARAASPREMVEANVRALRHVSTVHRLRTLATSEANRASYRTREASEQSNDLAAGAESRAIEFGAQQVLMVRTPPGHADVCHVRVAKNRRADRGEFWLRLIRQNHNAVECTDPAGTPEVQEERARSAKVARVRRDAEVVAAVVRREPGIGERGLRAAVAAEGHTWGKDRLDGAKALLQSGALGVRLVNRGPHARQAAWHLELDDEGGSNP